MNEGKDLTPVIVVFGAGRGSSPERAVAQGRGKTLRITHMNEAGRMVSRNPTARERVLNEAGNFRARRRAAARRAAM